MKQILLFTFLSLFAFTLNAQNFVIEPSPTVVDEMEADLSGEHIGHSVLTNNTSGEVSLKWQVTTINAPEEWTLAVCDKNQCYFPGVTEAPNAVVISAGGESIIDLHVKPNGVAGCGEYEVKVTPFSNTNNVLVMGIYSFKLNMENCNTSAENLSLKEVRLYPNPTSGSFKLSDLENIPEAKQIVVHNLLGRQVKTFVANEHIAYNVADLPNGLYLVNLIDAEGGLLKTVRMNKISAL